MSDFETYICSYRHQGVDWTLEVKASSFEDARERLKQIGAWGRVDGVKVMTMSVPGPLFFIVRPIIVFGVWVANLFSGGMKR